MTTQLSLITGLMPYGRAAGHFKYITLHIACEDPAEIPKHLVYHEGDLTAKVRVKLLRWRFHENLPFPLYPERRQPRVNHINPPFHQQDPPPCCQQGSDTTTVEGSVNNYCSSSPPARRRRGGNEDKKNEKEGSQGEDTRIAAQNVTKMVVHKVTQDRHMAGLLGDTNIVQIGEALQGLMISLVAQTEMQTSPQRSVLGMREERG